MRSRTRRLISILLAVSIVFSCNSPAFAGEVKETGDFAELGSVGFREDTAEISSTERASENDLDAEKALSGNLVITSGTPDIKVSGSDTVSVDDIKAAIVETMKFTMGNTTYYTRNNCLYRESDDSKVSGKFTYNSVDISLNSIRKAGADLKDAVGISYTDDGKHTVKEVKGNQLIHYSATINNKKLIPGAKECNTVNGDIFLRTRYSGEVSSQRIPFGDGKFSVLVQYDACVEFRGKKVNPTSHYLASDNDAEDSLSKAVNGEVDGALGVACRLEKLSGNEWIPVDGKRSGNYYWKDTTGITLKKPKIYNGKKVASYYESAAPYFIIPATYKKKIMPNDLLTIEQKKALKTALKKTKIYFTIEPRKLSTDLITYSKYDPDKYYVKKLTYNSDKNTLKGAVQFRTYKTKKSTLNVRSMRKMGRKLKIVSKAKYDENRSKKKDVYFEYNSNNGTVTLTGINGYYGSAVINSSHIKVK
ncbi:MAG: hypothetical protein K5886_09000 [Lachnospiraceae bacterium]|nr:hypothetical protein [Lachnospiraceae bacterium]